MHEPIGALGNRAFEQLGDQGGDRRALAASQGDVGKERVALKRFNDGDHAIMAADPQVIALGDIVGQDYSRRLANS